MSINKVALIGATGNLGPAILKALLDGGYEVTVLSRAGSTSTDSLASHPKQKIVKVDFDDVNDIATALKGVEGLVSNVASHALLSQKKVVDGAIAAGVKRFLPSDFGADLKVETNKTVPFNMPKVEIHDYVVQKSQEHQGFSYTFVATGPFFDWCLKMGLFGNLKTHETTLWDGGETRFSTTTLASVGKVVAGVFKNLEATKNQELLVADTTITLKQIMGIAKEIDGQEWTTTTASTAEAYQAGMDEMKKPVPNFQFVVMNQLSRIVFAAEHRPDHGDKLDNDKVGLPVMTEEQVKEVIKSCMA